MSESENKDELVDADEGGSAPGGVSQAEEAEHTVIDTELGALIRAAAKDEIEVSTSTEDLANLGPAFTSSSDAEPVPQDFEGSTRVLRPGETRSGNDSEGLASSGDGSNESDSGELNQEDDGWGEPVVDMGADSVSKAWAELDDEGGAWDSFGERSAVKTRPTGMVADQAKGETGVYAEPEVPNPVEAARLLCIDGSAKGQEFPLMDDVNYVGRSVSNEVLIEDPSVSRIHAVITWKENGFRIEDKESNNGIYINGEKVSDCLLVSGDEIGVGSLLFRFIRVGDLSQSSDTEDESSTSPAPGLWFRDFRQGPYFRSVMFSFGLLLVTIALVVGIITSRLPSEGTTKQSDVMFQYFLNGVDAFKKHQWAESERQFTILLGLDSQHLRSQQYMEAIAIEKRGEKQLKLAKSSRVKGDLRGAYRYASDVGDSIYFAADAKEIVRKIDLELEARIARARSSIEAGQIQEALTLIDGVEAIRAGLPDVAALRDIAMRASKGTSTGAPSTKSVSVAARSVQTASKESPLTGPVGQAQQIFQSGRITEAIAHLEGDRNNLDARMMAEKMVKFRTAYKSGQDAHRAKRAGPGITLLTRALELESQIGGGESTFVSPIKKKLADLYYLQGSLAFGSEDWPKAFESYSMAVGYVSDYQRAMRGLEKLNEKAIVLYNQADAIRNSDSKTARTQWQLVLKMIPPSSPYYSKTKSRLRALP